MGLSNGYAEAKVNGKEAMAAGDKLVAADPTPKQLDLTDETLKAARKSQLLRALQGRGRASTFMGGDASFPTLGMPLK